MQPKIIKPDTCKMCKYSAMMQIQNQESLICRFNPPQTAFFILWHGKDGHPVPPFAQSGTEAVPVPHTNVMYQAVDPDGTCGQHKPKLLT